MGKMCKFKIHYVNLSFFKCYHKDDFKFQMSEKYISLHTNAYIHKDIGE